MGSPFPAVLVLSCPPRTKEKTGTTEIGPFEAPVPGLGPEHPPQAGVGGKEPRGGQVWGYLLEAGGAGLGGAGSLGVQGESVKDHSRVQRILLRTLQPDVQLLKPHQLGRTWEGGNAGIRAGDTRPHAGARPALGQGAEYNRDAAASGMGP